MAELVSKVMDEIFMPLTVGGESERWTMRRD